MKNIKLKIYKQKNKINLINKTMKNRIPGRSQRPPRRGLRTDKSVKNIK
jgi:hypothetical protein